MNYYTDVLKKYAVFQGRATRKEYWMFILLNSIVVVVLSVGEGAINGSAYLYYIYILAVLFPSTSVMVRRLHDTNHSGWWFFINLVPFIGGIIFIVFLVTNSQAVDNQYGSNPKAGAIGQNTI